MKKLALMVFLCGTTATAFGQVADTDKKNDSSDELQEVVVTGTLIRGAGPTGSQLVTVDNAAIVATGTTNTADLLATVPALNSFNSAPQGGPSEFNSGGSSTPGLHGLPGTATLVLLDGHRLVGDSPLLTVPDPSSIPPSAIDHIEIVADGGSAIYGSDAVAGVINIILKKNYEGAETTVSYGGASRYDTASVGQNFGETWSTGSALVAATFENNSDLPNNARSFYTANLTPFGGTDTRTPNCAPANVQIGSQTYAAPNLFPGPPTQCDIQAGADLYSQNRRYALVADLRQDLGESVHMFFDFKYTDDRQSESIAPNTISQAITNTNPFFEAPPGTGATSETVLYNTSNLGSQSDVFTSRSGMADLGATIDLGHSWQLTGDFNFGDSSSSTLNPSYSPNAFAAAAAGTTTATALDPFGTRTNTAVAQTILNWPLFFLADQKLYDLNVKADGSLVTLPGGDMKLAVGVANRHEEYDGSNPIGVAGESGYSNNIVSASRVVDSAYGELSVPIFGSGNQLPFLKRLTLSIAGRYDHYSDFGTTSNPKYGLTWTPVDGVNFRGSYGTSFHAPQLADLFGIDTRAGYTPNSSFVPPGLPPGSLVNEVFIAGGRSDLLPETAKTASFGVDLAPNALPGFKASFTYWMIRFNNQIEIPPTTEELFTVPGLYDRFVTFNDAGLTPQQIASVLNGIRLLGVLGNKPPPPVQEIIDLRRANIGATDVDGWDFDLHYQHQLSAGTLVFGLSGEYIFEYETNQGPGSATANNLTNGESFFTSDTSAYNVIPWHVRGTAGWQEGDFSTQFALNYTGHYNTGYATTAGGSSIQWVSPFVTVDWTGAWNLPATSGFAKNTRVQLNVYNLLDQAPPLVIQAGGYSPESASPIGRLIKLTLNKRW
jgi:iron complex outermembrane receptor protein